MTISTGPHDGPPSPDDPGAAGRLRWACYTTNHLVLCPGTKPDRRTHPRGDRREGPARPCGHSFGRVVTGYVYVRALLGPAVQPASRMVTVCPDCTAHIEFDYRAAEAA
jgi:hypothetical protein